MDNKERYTSRVHQLAQHIRTVPIDEHGFIVQHLEDERDVSGIHNLDDLAGFIHLIERREQWNNEEWTKEFAR